MSNNDVLCMGNRVALFYDISVMTQNIVQTLIQYGDICHCDSFYHLVIKHYVCL